MSDEPTSSYTTDYPVTIGSQDITLPIVPVSDRAAIALLMTIDRGVGFMDRAGKDLAGLLADTGAEVVATNATLGIPVAIETSRALGLDDYLVLQKTPKIHLADALVEDMRSITTDADQALRLDQARVPLISGRRVVLVDDVIATGGSIAAALRLLRAGGADVVAVGALLTEGDGWRRALGPDADLVRTLGRIPGFMTDEAGGWLEVWD
ncbi:MAG: phosphoribosyltransferase family protein [Actinomycetota bacterium]|nr:phosphoribosyltransferase family protein [Actinomycetota bacterium]